jgi:hypothetical protein
MRRYVIRANARWSDTVQGEVQDVSPTVFEDNDPKPTGLLDAHGNKIFSVPERGMLGFDLRRTR